MRKREKRSLNETQTVLVRPLEESSLILNAMVKMALRLHKPMSEDFQNQLLSDLGPYPVPAIEWALDSWGRNAKVLPTLSDLLGLLRTWYSDTVSEVCECEHLHGRGYGLEDVKWLMELRLAKTVPGEKWSLSQWEELFDELDERRQGGPPAWRKTYEGRQFLRI